MPNCKNCGARLTKFDKDICPVCGCKNPLDGVVSETVEITTEIDLSDENFSNYKPLYKKTLLLLFCLIGWTGAPFFYLKNKKWGLIYLLLNIALIAGVGVPLMFTSLTFWGLVIAFGVSYVTNIVIGIVFYFMNNLRDSGGNYVR